MKKILTAILMVSMVLTCAGCGNNTNAVSSKSNSNSSITSESNATETNTSGKLIIGLDDSFPPMGFRDENNEIVGFDIDLAKEVAKRLNLEPVPTPIDWSTKELELNSGKVDVLWNGVTITEARQEAMLMSSPYIKNAQVVVVKKDSEIKSIKDLSGKKIAYQDGSSAVDAYAQCEAFGTEKEIITSPENITLLEDLKLGRIDAVVIDKVVSEFYITKNTDCGLVLLEEELCDESYGFAIKKGNTELAEKIYKVLEEMVEDGTAEEISNKWFGENRVIFKNNN